MATEICFPSRSIPKKKFNDIVKETQTITSNHSCIKLVKKNLLEVFLFGVTVLELTRKWAQLIITRRDPKSGSNQLMMLLAGKLEQTRLLLSSSC